MSSPCAVCCSHAVLDFITILLELTNLASSLYSVTVEISFSLRNPNFATVLTANKPVTHFNITEAITESCICILLGGCLSFDI